MIFQPYLKKELSFLIFSFFILSVISNLLQFLVCLTSPLRTNRLYTTSGPIHCLPSHQNSHRGTKGKHPDEQPSCQSSTQPDKQAGREAGFHYVLGCECWLLAAAACVWISYCGRRRVDGLRARDDAENPLCKQQGAGVYSLWKE